MFDLNSIFFTSENLLYDCIWQVPFKSVTVKYNKYYVEHEKFNKRRAEKREAKKKKLENKL